MESLNIRIPEPVKTKLKHQAVDEKKDMTEIVLEALDDYFKKKTKKK